VSEQTQSQGKGRPTPKRSEAEKRRGGPVPPPPTTRKEAAKQLRAKQAANRTSVRKSNLAGDDAHLMPRDRGPVRRLVRNTVDGRRGLGFMLLPVAAILVVAQFSRDPAVLALAVGIWLATLVGVAFDLMLTSILLRKAIREQFPEQKKLFGHIAYGLLRSTVIRRFRMPRPQVLRGSKKT
jgi:hypothetical protein